METYRYNNGEIQHPKGTYAQYKLPKLAPDWDKKDHEFVGNFICNHTEMFFEHMLYYYPKDIGDWRHIYTYKFRCDLNWQVNDKIRVMYYAPITNPSFKAEYEQILYGIAKDKNLARPRPSEASLYNVTMIKFDKFADTLNLKMDAYLTGVKYRWTVFHSKDLLNDTKFNNWDF